MNEILNTLKSIQQMLEGDVVNKWMSIQDVIKYSGLSYSTLHRSIKKGTLRVSKTTGKNLFRKEWVDTFLGV